LFVDGDDFYRLSVLGYDHAVDNDYSPALLVGSSIVSPAIRFSETVA
jgi:hypothetical protein